METLEDVLEHYGIKGMKWGVRRKRGADGHVTVSEDHAKAAAAQAKIKSGGAKALSNQELQHLVNRMNLEQQYGRLAPPSKKKAASKLVADILVNVGKQQAMKLANDAASKQVKKMMENATK